MLLGRLLHLRGSQNHVVVLALESHVAFHLADAVEVVREALEKLDAQVDVRNFAAAELDDGFNPIAFLEESDRVVLFKFVIMIVGVGAEFHLLHLYDVLFLLSLMLFLLVLVLPLAVIHSLGDRWIRCRRYEDEVESQVERLANGLLSWHDGDDTVRKDGTHLPGPDGFIYVFSDSNTRTARRVIAWIHSVDV